MKKLPVVLYGLAVVLVCLLIGKQYFKPAPALAETISSSSVPEVKEAQVSNNLGVKHPTTYAELSAFITDNHESKEIIIKNECYKINAMYPQFAGSFSILNNDIEKMVVDCVLGHIQSSLELYEEYETDYAHEEYRPPFPFEYSVSYKLVYENERYKSFYLEFYGYDGGVHGYSFKHDFNYDLVEKKYLDIKDFVKNETMLAHLRDFCKKELLEKHAIEEPWKEGLESYDHFAVFAFNDKEIQIHFQEYQVCCYAQGAPIVTVPFEIL